MTDKITVSFPDGNSDEAFELSDSEIQVYQNQDGNLAASISVTGERAEKLKNFIRQNSQTSNVSLGYTCQIESSPEDGDVTDEECREVMTDLRLLKWSLLNERLKMSAKERGDRNA